MSAVPEPALLWFLWPLAPSALSWLWFLISLWKGGIWRLPWPQFRSREKPVRRADSEIRAYCPQSIVEVDMIMDFKDWKQQNSEIVINVKMWLTSAVEIRIKNWWWKSEREKTSKSSFRIWNMWLFIQRPFLFYIIHSKSADCHQWQNLTSSAYFKYPIITAKAHIRTSFHNSLHWLPWVCKISEQK